MPWWSIIKPPYNGAIKALIAKHWEYAAKAKPAVEKFAGKFLVRGGKNRTTDGIKSPRTVVVEFPDYNSAMQCYDSKEYQDAHEVLDGHVVRHHQIVEAS